MFGRVGSPFAGGTNESFDDHPLGNGVQQGNRRPAVNGRVTGTITEWKGKFGWVMPDEPIQHPEARMKGGKVYLSQEDVAEVIDGVGAHVSFYVYADGTGMGAMLCVPSDSPAASKPFVHKTAKAKMPPKPKAKATPGRKRVSEKQMTGKVKQWKGGFGFVTPSEPIDHPLFTGNLFLHKADVDRPEELEAGKTVTFYLYADPQGLGAEDCTIGDGDDDAAEDMPKPASPSEDSGAAGLLRAKPKASAAAGALAFAAPRAKAMLRATPKAGPGSRPMDAELAAKMAAKPELARRLNAWIMDAGG